MAFLSSSLSLHLLFLDELESVFSFPFFRCRKLKRLYKEAEVFFLSSLEADSAGRDAGKIDIRSGLLFPLSASRRLDVMLSLL